FNIYLESVNVITCDMLLEHNNNIYVFSLTVNNLKLH
ncbi:MAG: hypothetical protein ACI8Q1_002752, partial [Parvicella sp.]